VPDDSREIADLLSDCRLRAYSEGVMVDRDERSPAGARHFENRVQRWGIKGWC